MTDQATDRRRESVENDSASIDAADRGDTRDDRHDMPLPSDPHTIFLGGLLLLAVLAVLYVASEIVLPVVLAIVLKLLLQPLVRTFDRIGLPRPVSALMALLLLIFLLTALISALTGPAADWAGKLPEALPELQQKLAILHRPIAAIHSVFDGILSFTTGGVRPFPEAPASRSASIMHILLSGTATIVAGLFTTLVVLFYLLVAGETFLRRLVEILPRFADKRQAVEISLDIERNISVYLITLRVWGLPRIFSQAASWKPCILLVSARLARNFVKMWSFGVSRRNSGSRWRSAVATTSSEGGIPDRTVRSQDPKEAQTSRGCATERYCSNPWQMRPV